MPEPPATERDAEAHRRLAAAVPEADLEAAWAAYEGALIAGLCHEGAWEVALGRARGPTPTAEPGPRIH